MIRRSVHPAVRDAQRRLNAFHRQRIAAGQSGLADAPLDEDCIFGAKTERSLISFQQIVFPGQPSEHDGRLGARTWAQFDRVAIPAPAPAPSAPVSSPPPPAPPSPPIAAPGLLSRPCCLLEPGSLAGTTTHGDHSATIPRIVYTGGAGFVDFGHLWDQCDLTAWVYQNLHSAGGASGTSFSTGQGTVQITSNIPPDEWLVTARAIAYDESVAHEILTYDIGIPHVGRIASQHNSSFSPEDLCSNFLGTLIAERALVVGGSFIAAAEREVARLMLDLNAQNDAETAAAFARISSRWIDLSKSPGSDLGYLRRRNFTREPWKTGHASDAPTPVYVIAPVTLTLRYDSTYKSRLSTPSSFSRADMPTEIAKIKTDAKARYGNDFDKP
jgi:hypothetical protein